MKTTPRACMAFVCVVFALLSIFGPRPQAQTPTVTLTIHMVGQGSPPATGAVGTGFGVCNSANGSDCVFTIPTGANVKVAGNQPAGSTPAVLQDGTGSAASCATSTCRFTITQNSEITAVFNPNAPTLTMTVNLAGAGPGEVGADNNVCQNYDHNLSQLPTQFSACSTSYAPNSEVTLGVRTPAGARFTGFSNGTVNAGACTTAPCSFVLSAATSITATFRALTSLAVTPALETANINQQKTFTATGTYDDGLTAQAGGFAIWRTRASMPTARYSFAAAAANGRLYAIGGSTSSGPIASVEEYDPLSNTWAVRAGLLSPRAAFGAASLDGLVYVAGGSGPGNCPLDVFEIYNPALDSWMAGPAMPGGPRKNAVTVAVGRKIYVIGGELNVCGSPTGAVLDRVEAYDVDTQQWSTLANMPTARRFFGAGAVQGRIYAVGGDNTSQNLQTVEAYSPATNTWTAKNPLPAPRSMLAVTVIGDAVYAVGGGNGNYFNDVFVLDTSTDFWSRKGQLPALIEASQQPGMFINISSQRAEHAVATLNGRMYALGGLLSPGGSYVPYVTAWTDNQVWASTNAGVGKVGQTGQAIGVSRGTVTISASSGDVSCADTGQCATLNVTNVVSSSNPVVTIFGGPATIAAGSNLSRSGSFNDPDNGPWTGTVNYGDNTGTQPLALGPGGQGGSPTGTFNLNHVYAQAGNYILTVRVTDSTGAFGSASIPVTVTQGQGAQIFLGLPTTAQANVGGAQWGCGSFFDQDATGGAWIGEVNYGDGFGVQGLPLTVPAPGSGPCVGGPQPPTGVFFFNHAYASAGSYSVTVTVKNTVQNRLRTQTFTVVVTDGECAQVTLSITGTSLPFNSLLVDVTRNGQHDDEAGQVPIGVNTIDIEPGSYHVVFSVPPGYPDYVVVPSTFDFTLACGGAATLTMQVKRLDTTPPVISSVTPGTGSLWPPNHKMVGVSVAAQATDDSGQAPVCSIASVSSNEPIDGTGDGDTGPDWNITGPLSVELRSERAGGGSGRIYTITVSCADAAGNTSTKATQVVVPHDQSKKK